MYIRVFQDKEKPFRRIFSLRKKDTDGLSFINKEFILKKYETFCIYVFKSKKFKLPTSYIDIEFNSQLLLKYGGYFKSNKEHTSLTFTNFSINKLEYFNNIIYEIIKQSNYNLYDCDTKGFTVDLEFIDTSLLDKI